MNRPRIFFARGYWRVSPMPKPFHTNSAAWVLAHSYVNYLNDRKLAATRRVCS